MEAAELYSQLLCCKSEIVWRDLVFKFANDLGYVGTVVVVFPDHSVPLDAKPAFLHSDCSPAWRARYENNKLWRVDPTIAHCLARATPILWSPDIFSGPEQLTMYEEACRHGIRAGIAFPMHGARGEFGVLCLVSDRRPDERFRREAYCRSPTISCLRDFVLESSIQLMRLRKAAAFSSVTGREMECLKWSAAGKTSWEISQILYCSEATVNFHLKNLRKKFDVTSRQQVVVKAIRMGLLPQL